MQQCGEFWDSTTSQSLAGMARMNCCSLIDRLEECGPSFHMHAASMNLHALALWSAHCENAGLLLTTRFGSNDDPEPSKFLARSVLSKEVAEETVSGSSNSTEGCTD